MSRRLADMAAGFADAGKACQGEIVGSTPTTQVKRVGCMIEARKSCVPPIE